MRINVFYAIILLNVSYSYAQTGVDTIHYKKVYYFAGTGLGIPLGKTNEVLSPKVFAGSMGVDFTLRNPKYYVYPALYMLSFKYKQQYSDPDYNKIIEDGGASIYMLSLAAGRRKQYNRLNAYIYAGPTIGLVSEPRAEEVGDIVKIHHLKSIAFGTKVGVGADYKFPGFFVCSEFGYMYNFNRIQGRPFQALTIMVGLKSDITKIKNKVVDILTPIVSSSSSPN
ncbi:hypothetical protein G5B30_06475 [Sphingobacterium sp. SGG-5]|uniref:hypothetical protein n=1 Tax=Sphingobacterium sp. SGG-5 TaxID=2710881 RepID=UPI0013EB4446|nr:hypothetical protein [Sphingobacterium sp. SGG-5]NGM61562.1 hypothetical protein [Sphingobacterium sp. SGG-5]